MGFWVGFVLSFLAIVISIFTLMVNGHNWGWWTRRIISFGILIGLIIWIIIGILQKVS